MSDVEALPDEDETGASIRFPRYTTFTHESRQKNISLAIVRHVPFVFVLGLTLYLMTINFTQPWVSVHEDNGLAFSSAAVNNIRYGFWPAKGLFLMDTEGLNAQSLLSIPGVPTSQEFYYLKHGPTHPYIYPDHPPLLNWTVTASLLTFGFHFWAVRLVPLTFSIATIVLVYFLMIRLFSWAMALFTAFLLGTFPMMAYFGRNVCFEALVLFFSIILLASYVYWCQTSQKRWLFLTALSVVLGLCTDWPMFFFAFIVFAIHCLSVKRVSWSLFAATIVPALVTCSVIFSEVAWALHGNLEPMKEIFLFRTGDTGYGGVPVNSITWVRQVTNWNAEGFGTWSQWLMPCAIFFIAVRASAEGMSLRVRIVTMTFLFGLSNVVAFRQAAFMHAYWQQYFLPFYAITFGWAFSYLVGRYVSNTYLKVLPYVAAGISILVLNWPTIVMLHSSPSGVFVPLLSLWH